MTRGVIKAPLRIPKNKRGDMWSVNLNQYRNTHYQTSNTVKRKYKDLVTPQIKPLSPFSCIRLSIYIYAKDRRTFDIGNIGSIQEKFFLDAMVELGKLKDDTYEYVPETHTYFAGIDKDDPRVEFIIEEIVPMFQINRPKRVPVEVLVSDSDIQNLIKEKLAEQGIDAVNVAITGEFDVVIEAYEAETATTAAKKAPTRRKKAAPKKSEPVVVAEDDNEEPVVINDADIEKLEKADAALAMGSNAADDVPFETDTATTKVEAEQKELIDELFSEEVQETTEPEPKKTTVADIFDFS